MNETELLELLEFFAPETLEGWLAAGVIICAVLAIVLPHPGEDSHPAWRLCHKIICVVGIGAGRMKAAGRLGKIGKLTGIFRRKK